MTSRASGPGEPLRHRSRHGQHNLYLSRQHGERPCVLLLHGGPGMNGYPERQILWPLYAGRLNLLWFDLLGCHESPAHDPAAVTLDATVEAIHELVAEHAGGPVDIIAHCAGTRLTHRLIRRFPADVRRTVFISSSEREARAFKNIVQLLRDDGRLAPGPETEATVQRFLATPEQDFGPEQARTIAELFLGARDPFDVYWRDPAARDEFMACAARAPIDPTTFITLAGEDFAEPLETAYAELYAHRPLLLVQGVEDAVTRWAEQGQRIRDHVDHAQVAMIEEAAHWPQFEQRTETLRVIAEFLEQ